jgi:hypothetical protein
VRGSVVIGRHPKTFTNSEVAQLSGQKKSRPKAALNSNLMMVDQAAIKASIDGGLIRDHQVTGPQQRHGHCPPGRPQG